MKSDDKKALVLVLVLGGLLVGGVAYARSQEKPAPKPGGNGLPGGGVPIPVPRVPGSGPSQPSSIPGLPGPIVIPGLPATFPLPIPVIPGLSLPSQGRPAGTDPTPGEDPNDPEPPKQAAHKALPKKSVAAAFVGAPFAASVPAAPAPPAPPVPQAPAPWHAPVGEAQVLAPVKSAANWNVPAPKSPVALVMTPFAAPKPAPVVAPLPPPPGALGRKAPGTPPPVPAAPVLFKAPVKAPVLKVVRK